MSKNSVKIAWINLLFWVILSLATGDKTMATAVACALGIAVGYSTAWLETRHG